MAAFRSVRFSGLAGDMIGGPGLSTTPAGGLAMAEGAAAVRQSIMLLLSTVPGERVMRPDYGCALHRLVFLPNDATTAGLAIHYVREALIRFEPRIEIVRLDAEADREAPERLRVELEYRLRSSLEESRLDLAVDLDGGGG